MGLGLSLAQAVAKLHGSGLELSNREPGLKVVITIPCIEPAGSPGVSPANGMATALE